VGQAASAHQYLGRELRAVVAQRVGVHADDRDVDEVLDAGPGGRGREPLGAVDVDGLDPPRGRGVDHHLGPAERGVYPGAVGQVRDDAPRPGRAAQHAHVMFARAELRDEQPAESTRAARYQHF